MAPLILPGDIIRFRAPHLPDEIAGWGVVHHVAGGNMTVIVVDAIRSDRTTGVVPEDRVMYLRGDEVETVVRGGGIVYNMPRNTLLGV